MMKETSNVITNYTAPALSATAPALSHVFCPMLFRVETFDLETGLFGLGWRVLSFDPQVEFWSFSYVYIGRPLFRQGIAVDLEADLPQIAELYDDFHITKLPLLECEVRGPQQIREFSERLAKPELNQI